MRISHARAQRVDDLAVFPTISRLLKYSSLLLTLAGGMRHDMLLHFVQRGLLVAVKQGTLLVACSCTIAYSGGKIRVCMVISHVDAEYMDSTHLPTTLHWTFTECPIRSVNSTHVFRQLICSRERLTATDSRAIERPSPFVFRRDMTVTLVLP